MANSRSTRPGRDEPSRCSKKVRGVWAAAAPRGSRVLAGAGWLLLVLLLTPAAFADIAIEVPRFNLAGRDLRARVTVTEVPANRKLRIFVLLDGQQVHTVDLGTGVHSLRFEGLRPPPGRHELALQVGRERVAGFVRVVPWWAAASALVLPVALLLLAFERLRRRC